MPRIGHVEELQTAEYGLADIAADLDAGHREITGKARGVHTPDHDVLGAGSRVVLQHRDQLRMAQVVIVDDLDPGRRAGARPDADVGVLAVRPDVCVQSATAEIAMPENEETVVPARAFARQAVR